MFEFISDLGNYEDRKVNLSKYDWGFVSTARVSDGRKPYETAVKHRLYNDGEIVIVEYYDTMEEAKTGHDKWVGLMTSSILPDELTDCCNSGIQQLIGAETFKRKVQS